MNHADITRWAELQTRVTASQMAHRSAREHLIERLGDFLCDGSTEELTHAELKVLARARRDAAQAQCDLALFLSDSILTSLTQSASAVVSSATWPIRGSKASDRG